MYPSSRCSGGDRSTADIGVVILGERGPTSGPVKSRTFFLFSGLNVAVKHGFWFTVCYFSTGIDRDLSI